MANKVWNRKRRNINININFESLRIISQLLDKEVELSILSTQSLSFSLLKEILGPSKREDNKIILTACFANFFRNGLINMHRTQCARFLCMTNF